MAWQRQKIIIKLANLSKVSDISDKYKGRDPEGQKEARVLARESKTWEATTEYKGEKKDSVSLLVRRCQGQSG